jgi:hypothetical protein
MVECIIKGLSYNCDEKCFLGHKSKGHKNFIAIVEDVSNENVEVSPKEELPQNLYITSPSYPTEIKPQILLNPLTRFSTPQTLKLIGYIKHRKVIILVDSGNTHNFIHHRLAQEINFYIRVVNNFQIMSANGGSVKCGGRCKNVHLQIGQYKLKSHIIAINIGGFEIMLGSNPCATTLIHDFMSFIVNPRLAPHPHMI